MSYLETSPKTATAFNAPQVLDLCTRRRSGSESPRPEGAHQPMKTSPEVHSSIPEYMRSSPIIPQFPTSINNNTLEQRKSPYQTTLDQQRQSPYQTTLDQRQSPISSIDFQNNNNNINNNFLEHATTPFMVNQFNSPIYRPPVKSDIDSSEEGSVKSDSNDFTPNLTPNLGGKVKATRPFKAYPKDPFFLALGACSADAILGKESAEAYAEFRQKMLCQVRANNPEPGVTNAKMRRSTIPTSTQDMDGKDASYWEKRKKNNEAAKRSRDARRAKEDEIAIRAAFLEQENLKLKYEIAALRNENTKFRCLLYN